MMAMMRKRHSLLSLDLHTPPASHAPPISPSQPRRPTRVCVSDVCAATSEPDPTNSPSWRRAADALTSSHNSIRRLPHEDQCSCRSLEAPGAGLPRAPRKPLPTLSTLPNTMGSIQSRRNNKDKTCAPPESPPPHNDPSSSLRSDGCSLQTPAKQTSVVRTQSLGSSRGAELDQGAHFVHGSQQTTWFHKFRYSPDFATQSRPGFCCEII